MRTPCRLLVAMGALSVLLAGSSTHALPVDDYLKLRRQAGYEPGIDFAQVEASPSVYVDRVLELRGTVDGTVRREQKVSFLLTLPSRRSILLDAPPADVGMASTANHQALRVLARVSATDTGNVVPLVVLAMAYDGEVTLRERAAMARAAEARERARRADVQQRTVWQSRGGAVRQAPAAGGAVWGLASRYLTPEAQAVYPAYLQFIGSCNRRLTSDELDAITVSILHFSQRYRVDPRLVIAMIIAESSFNPRSTSHKGAMGLGQIMPDEARALNLSNPYDPIQNVKASVGLLKGKLDRYRDPGCPDGFLTMRQVELALAAYNAGPGAVRRYGGVPPYRETQGYIKRVTGIYRKLIGL